MLSVLRGMTLARLAGYLIILGGALADERADHGLELFGGEHPPKNCRSSPRRFGRAFHDPQVVVVIVVYGKNLGFLLRARGGARCCLDKKCRSFVVVSGEGCTLCVLEEQKNATGVRRCDEK
jgi:hypothetical protein